MRIVMLIVWGLMMTAVPAMAQQNTVPRFESGPCPFTAPFGTEPECGMVTVPENRSQPDGDTIQLAVAVFKSDSPARNDAPIIYLDGGPGGSTTETIGFTYDLLVKPYAVDHDYIIFDQRGVGNSKPALDCPEYEQFALDTINIQTTPEEDVAGQTEAFVSCAERLTAEGVDLTVYNSAENAADVADIIRVLGYEQANLYGISYGSKLALTIMRDHPEVVRSAIIDAVFPQAIAISDTPISFQRSLNVLFETCKADPSCNAAYPNLEDVFYGLVNQLNAEPVSVMTADINTFQQREALVDGDDFAGLIFNALYLSEIIPALPKSIYAVQEGDTTLLSVLLSNQIFQLNTISLGMNNAVQCNEEVPFSTKQSIQAVLEELRPELQGFARRGLTDPAVFSICKAYSTKAPAALENEAVTSSIPTLVSSGQFDPITPPANGDLAAQTLSQSTVITFPGKGHGATLSSDCARGIVRAFLQDPSQTPDTSCINDMVVAFETGPIETPAVTLIPFTNEAQGYSGVIPEGWAEQAILPGTYARQQNGLDQTALVFQSVPGAGVEMIIPLLSAQFGVDADSVVEREANGLNWRLLKGVLQGIQADVALTEGGGRILLIIMTSSAEERAALYEAVFLPVVDGFTLTN